MTLRTFCAVTAACCFVASATAAIATPRYGIVQHCDDYGRCFDIDPVRSKAKNKPLSSTGDKRPGKWCGWWMRQQFGVVDKAFNRARLWARYGTNAHGPAVGVIVVWPHHVGIITGRGEKHWIVKSGNDGNMVRERERGIGRAIAFRWPNGVASR